MDQGLRVSSAAEATSRPIYSPIRRLAESISRTQLQPRIFRGLVKEAVGMVVKAAMPGVQMGELCELHPPGGKKTFLAEVIGFTNDAVLLMPMGDAEGLSPSTQVVPLGRKHTAPVGSCVLGRVLNALGDPIDSAGPLDADTFYPLNAEPPNPMTRKIIDRPLTLGVRVLDGLLTCGEGQRLGIFAAAGVGKSTLLAQILRNTEADIVVLCLIGERGREVREFLEMVLTPETRKRTVVIVSTSDRPAAEWVKSAYLATAIAEYFRDQGRKVLLLIDSLTRFARAQRLIGLAAGEPPARRGFPPSVFASLPRLLERSGNSETGSITALYTILVEGDDMNEPVADEVRSILDGHIVLSRKIAASNHYPAVDVLESVSRVMNQIVTQEHREAAGQFRDLLTRYKETDLLIKIGEYKPGSDAQTDKAISRNPDMEEFLKQPLEDKSSFEDAVSQLEDIVQ